MLAKIFTIAALLGSAFSLNHKFTVFDATEYPNMTIGYGTSPINHVPDYECDPLLKKGLPSEKDWKKLIEKFALFPGYPMQLDCQGILEPHGINEDNTQVMKTLQTWSAQVLPNNTIIGWFNLIEHTNVTNSRFYLDIIANYSNQAFFPAPILWDAVLKSWKRRITLQVGVAKNLGPELPLWPVLLTPIDDMARIWVDNWKKQIEWLIENVAVNGFVVRGPGSYLPCVEDCLDRAPKSRWLRALRQRLTKLYGLYGDVPQREGAQVFTGV